MSNFVPQMEYHFTTYSFGTWMESSEVKPRGLTFAEIRAGWTFAEKFVPLRLSWPKWAWPGGYPIYYVTKDVGILCADCANKELDRTLEVDDEQFYIVAGEINYEDNELQCDHCNCNINPAYSGD